MNRRHNLRPLRQGAWATRGVLTDVAATRGRSRGSHDHDDARAIPRSRVRTPRRAEGQGRQCRSFLSKSPPPETQDPQQRVEFQWDPSPSAAAPARIPSEDPSRQREGLDWDPRVPTPGRPASMRVGRDGEGLSRRSRDRIASRERFESQRAAGVSAAGRSERCVRTAIWRAKDTIARGPKTAHPPATARFAWQ